MRTILPAAVAAMALSAAAASGAPVVKRPGGKPSRPPLRRSSHISLHLSRHAAIGGRRVVVHGKVRPRGRRRVKLVFRGPGKGVERLVSRRDGVFRTRWRPHGLGSYKIRAYVAHRRHFRAATSVGRRLTVYRLAEASYYGPGLYGGALACGGSLQPGTLGVANRSLPCGTRVKLRYRGRSISVPVVDRGPYAAGRDFDLTAATKARLRFPDTGVLMASR